MGRRKVARRNAKKRARKRNPKIKGSSSIQLKLQKLGDKSKKDNTGKYLVKYEAPYALFVHENKTARHEPGKQAKFLEQPARVEKPTMSAIVRKTVASGGTVNIGMNLAALYLKRKSQELCPISGWDPVISPLLPTSGTLHNSAKVVKEK